MKQIHRFAQSKIWEAGNPIDHSAEIIEVSASSKTKAEKILAKRYGKEPSTGRTWIYLGTKETNQ